MSGQLPPFKRSPHAGGSEYDPTLHGWLDEPLATERPRLAGAVMAGLGGLVALAAMIGAARSQRR